MNPIKKDKFPLELATTRAGLIQQRGDLELSALRMKSQLEDTEFVASREAAEPGWGMRVKRAQSLVRQEMVRVSTALATLKTTEHEAFQERFLAAAKAQLPGDVFRDLVVAASEGAP